MTPEEVVKKLFMQLQDRQYEEAEITIQENNAMMTEGEVPKDSLELWMALTGVFCIYVGAFNEMKEKILSIFIRHNKPEKASELFHKYVVGVESLKKIIDEGGN